MADERGNCIHGGNPSWCAYCNPKKEDPAKLRRPTKRTGATVHGAGAGQTHASYQSGYVVIPSHHRRRGAKKPSIDRRITFVHIDGYPKLWLIQELLETLPNLHTIQVTPKIERGLSSTHRRACEERGVRLITGYHNPSLAWDEGENRSPYYRQQRMFLLRLTGEQKLLFEELLQLGFHSATMAARYFCLREEEFKTQLEVAQEMDFPPLQNYVSAHINAVFCYLDPSFKAAKEATRIAEVTRMRVLRLRAILAKAARREEIARQLGLDRLPEGMPLSRFDTFEAVVKASREPSFQDFTARYPREQKIITLRYGLEDGVYRTLEDIGQRLGGLTRERIRQLEEIAFKALGIVDE